MLDQKAMELFSKNRNMLVPWYLMASYAYYREDDPILSDGVYDQMSKDLIQYWDQIEHYHKHLINKDDLVAGSYLGEYPTIVVEALKDLRKKNVSC